MNLNEKTENCTYNVNLYRTLFWIEERSNTNFVIMKSLMDISKATIIQRKLNTFMLLTIDVHDERLYWAETNNQIWSIKFDGTDKKVHQRFLQYYLHLVSILLY